MISKNPPRAEGLGADGIEVRDIISKTSFEDVLYLYCLAFP